MNEEWRAVLDGAYEVSDTGNIRRAMPGRRTWPGKILKSYVLPNGYHFCQPTVDGKNKSFYMHILVARAFIGPCPDGKEVNHRDGDKGNNTPGNLEYVTRKENMQHAIALGLAPQCVKRPPRPRKPRTILRGEDHWMRKHPEKIVRGEHCGHNKLSEADVTAIREAHRAGAVQRALARTYKVSPAQICRIVNGKHWSTP